MILNDQQILDLCWPRWDATTPRMIEPFEPRQVSDGVVSYGLSSFGYDMRVADEWRGMKRHVPRESVVDVKDLKSELYLDLRQSHIDMPPHSFALARSVEYFRIPDDIFVLCVGKSTYARAGLVVGITPLEPGWEGHVTIELSNTTPLPVRVYANEGISQCVFYRGERPGVTYGDRKGKYQGQQGITLPKV